jgi:hypothetical protein
VIGTFVVLAAIAGVLGSLSAPDRMLWDPRRSSELRGPAGMKGLADAFQRLGIPVERRRSSFFGLADESEAIDSTAWIVIPTLRTQGLESARAFADAASGSTPTAVERRELMHYLERGGAVFVAGYTGLADCFGLDIDWERGAGVPKAPPGLEVDALPPARYVIRTLAGDDRPLSKTDVEQPRCVAPPLRETRALLTTPGGIVARRMAFEGGGRAIVLADSRYLSNEFLRDTDAGLVVLPLLLDERPSLLIMDEYHLGFGRGGSIFVAAWRWLRRSPGGWTILQLAAAGLLALGVAAIRFGPALRLVERRRRSPLEHLDALAVGLERAGGRETAVERIVSGLRRRLSRAGYRPRGDQDDYERWLAGLALATRSDAAHAAVERLDRLVRQRGGDERVLATAAAVEDVWEALRQVKTPEPS